MVDTAQEVDAEKHKNIKGIIYKINLFLLVLNILASLYFLFSSFILLLVGQFIYFALLVVGLIIVGQGFVLSSQTEKYAIEMQKTQNEEKKKVKKRNVLAIIISLLGSGIIATVIGILTTREWDIW